MKKEKPMTNPRGRPKLPDDAKLTHVSLRLPKWLVEWYEGQGNRSKAMRHALEQYTKEQDNA